MMVVIYGRYACAWRHGKSEPFLMTREMQSCIVADHYLPLPSKFDIHGYGIMERFCYAIEDDDIGDALCRAYVVEARFVMLKTKSTNTALLTAGTHIAMKPCGKW